MNKLVESAKKTLGLPLDQDLSEGEIKKAFWDTVKKSHPESVDYDGNKHDLSCVVDAKELLLELLKQGSSDIVHPQKPFAEVIADCKEQINNLRKQGCSNNDILNIFGFDFLCDFVRHLSELIYYMDLDLFAEDYDEYNIEQDEIFSRLKLFIEISDDIGFESKGMFLEMLAGYYMCKYIPFAIEREYAYGTFHKMEGTYNCCKEVLNDFAIEDTLKFCIKMLDSNEMLLDRRLRDDFNDYLQNQATLDSDFDSELAHLEDSLQD